MTNENRFRWVEIYVQDMARARKFYESVCNVRLERLQSPDDSELWAFPMAMNAPGAAGALVRMEGVPSGGNSTIAYFACEDCAVEASRVAAAGGRVHKDKFPIGQYGFIALGFDTEGNLFGLHSAK
jgi:predicted enzyme related to lactoylglutathione lyase